ncbi:zinc finger protein 704-like [Rhopilema esculentum]|uniref:zinc finger protein 704-like n=1 Tax=Rhopilema esculentum TaxID=499914 RepID=UPI0031E3F2C6
MQNQRFVFPLTTQRDEDKAMEPGGMQADEGYSDSIIKPRTRSFETPKLTKSREKRAGSLDLHVDEPIREQKLERAESWDVEKYGPDNKTQKLEKGNKAFKCMWRGCGRVLMSLPGIVRHVRTAHLGPKTEDNVEFYFNDLFIENDASISSDDSLLSSGISDDDALLENEDTKKGGLHMTARRDDALKTFLPSYLPKNDNMQEYFLPRADKGARTKIGKSKGRIRSSREKAGYAGLETARKCRKVYGMDNRNLWCTQCRWKKACVRFGK